ncbi:MAG: hypothetical protein ACOC7T_01615 [Planctomycetota bacterium]
MDIKLTENTRLLLGIASLWPPFYALLYLAFLIVTAVVENRPGAGWRAAETMMLLLHLFTIALVCSVGAVYFYWLYQTEELATRRKIRWAVAIALAFPVTMALFYFRFFVAEQEEAAFVEPDWPDEGDEEEPADVVDVE